jgi:hypothetical protein
MSDNKYYVKYTPCEPITQALGTLIHLLRVSPALFVDASAQTITSECRLVPKLDFLS